MGGGLPWVDLAPELDRAMLLRVWSDRTGVRADLDMVMPNWKPPECRTWCRWLEMPTWEVGAIVAMRACRSERSCTGGIEALDWVETCQAGAESMWTSTGSYPSMAVPRAKELCHGHAMGGIAGPRVG